MALPHSMARAPSLRTKLMEDLSCKLCLEQFDKVNAKPRLLPCQHVCCSTCVEQMVNKAVQERRDFIHCAFCRQRVRIDDIPVDRYKMELLEAMASTQVVTTSERQPDAAQRAVRLFCSVINGVYTLLTNLLNVNLRVVGVVVVVAWLAFVLSTRTTETPPEVNLYKVAMAASMQYKSACLWSHMSRTQALKSLVLNRFDAEGYIIDDAKCTKLRLAAEAAARPVLNNIGSLPGVSSDSKAPHVLPPTGAASVPPSTTGPAAVPSAEGVQKSRPT